MPLYVYSCPACEIEIEERRPIVEADMPVVCPVCRDFCEREISTFGIGAARSSEAPAPTTARPVHMRHGPNCGCGPVRW